MTSRPFLVVLASLGLTACFEPSPIDSSSDASTGDTGAETEDPTVDPTNSTTSLTSATDISDSVEPSTGDPTDCPGGCDDAVDCTEDACVDGACVNTAMDSACDDEVDCTADSCDAESGCVNAVDDAMCDDGVDCTADSCDAAMGCVNEGDDTMCDDGVDCTADSCDGVDGCTATPDDLACDDGVGCTVDVCDAVGGCEITPDDTLCDDGNACSDDACDAVADCQFGDTVVLVLNGTAGSSTAPEDAVTALGYTPIVTVTDTDFNVAFDAGGFQAILVDVPSLVGSFTVDTQSRLDTWVTNDERLVFGFWNLGGDPAMAATLGVTVTASVDPPLPVYPATGAPVDLFDLVETLPAPLTYTDFWGDNGDQLSIFASGFAAGRFNDAASGPAAILVTHDDRVVTNGFIPSEAVQGSVDADADGLFDGQELLMNEISYVCSVP